MAAEFENFGMFYQELSENSISAKSVAAVEEWLQKKTSKNIMEKYSNGYKTDLEESFHHVVLKYWKKRSTYEYEEYVLKRALAVLDWNEARETLTHCYFRQDIADKFHEFMLSRKKSRINYST